MVMEHSHNSTGAVYEADTGGGGSVSTQSGVEHCLKKTSSVFKKS